MILPGNDINSIASGAQRISAGGLLGLPTETVYGLAADADCDAAVAQIFSAKGRPADHPLIVHVANACGVAHFAVDVPDFATQLMSAFWPGPLTLILPRRPGVATAAAGGHTTVGVRCPAHPVAQALLQTLVAVDTAMASRALPSTESAVQYGGVAGAASSENRRVWGVAAPSANQFGRVSPTTAAHVQTEFGDDLLILDGGPCSVGIESTIIDCSRGVPVLLRPGAITPAQVHAVCGLRVLQKEELSVQSAPAPKASGTLESHYAPKARVRLMDAGDLQTALNRLGLDPSQASGGAGVLLAVWTRAALAVPKQGVVCLPMPQDAETAARQLFARLRDFDAQGVSQIWVETPPDVPAWDGVRDRLLRASS